jgi:hypothetical protein
MLLSLYVKVGCKHVEDSSTQGGRLGIENNAQMSNYPSDNINQPRRDFYQAPMLLDG